MRRILGLLRARMRSTATAADGLTAGEQAQIARLLAERMTLPEALALHAAITSRGLSFELPWEARILELILRDDPERFDSLGRYRQVLMALGKPVPADIDARFARLAQQEEFGTNHQEAAQKYGERTGFEDTEPEFRAIAGRARAFTMTSMERMYALYRAVHYMAANRVAGDVVECGVWRGGSMMVVALTLLACGRDDIDLYLFDTYEGLPRPDAERDVDIWGNRAIDGWLPRQTGEESSHWAEASLEDVRANLLSTGYPEARLHFVKGMVERTLPQDAPELVALLRLDTDFYESTRHEMAHLWPRLVRDGVLIIDDYGHFKGARLAVDEYFAAAGHTPLMVRIDYSGRLVVKTGD